jgi:large conductance mechanosensitive channel
MFKEFKAFLLRGNVVDLSTGVIIGAAFGGIVSAFTKGVVEPILAIFGSGTSPDLKIPILRKMVDVVKDGKTVATEKLIELDLGVVIGSVVSFLITAAVIFFVIVKPANKLMAMMKKEEAVAAPAAPAEDIVLLREIRDALKK